jgi:hypothetical protein
MGEREFNLTQHVPSRDGTYMYFTHEEKLEVKRAAQDLPASQRQSQDLNQRQTHKPFGTNHGTGKKICGSDSNSNSR